MYHRFTNKNTPMSDYGHAMFAQDRDSVCDCYGDIEYLYDGEYSVEISDILSQISDAWDEDLENGMLPCGCEALGISGQEAADCFNPEDIVMSAEAWDNADMVMWFWSKIAEPADIKAVITSDGAIVFDEELIKAA